MARKKEPPANPLSENDKKYLDEMMQKWQTLLNLSDWRLSRSSKKTKHMAEMVGWDTTHRLVSYRIGDDFGAEAVTPRSLEKTAIHEMLHLRFHEMLEVAAQEDEYNDRVLAAEHAVITVLEPMLLELSVLRDDMRDILTAVRDGDSFSHSMEPREQHAHQASDAGATSTGDQAGA